MKQNRFKTIIFPLILFTSIAFFNSCKTKSLGINGIYTTANINILNAFILKWKYGGDFSYQVTMVLDLKKDSTFQLGFCNRKIAYDGNWKVDGDSVLLYNVFNYFSGKPVNSFKIFRESKEMSIFFPNRIKKTINNRDSIITTYSVLKINGKGFDGILNKGFLQPKDSIYKN